MKKKTLAFYLGFILISVFSTVAAYADQGFILKQGLGITAAESGQTSITVEITGNQTVISTLNYDTRDSVYVVSETGFGYRFSPVFTLDLTFLYYAPDFTTLDTVDLITTHWRGRNYVFLLNGYLSILPLFHKFYRFFDPYIGFGLGIAQNNTNDIVVFNEDNDLVSHVAGILKSNFAYRFIAGLNFHFTQQFLVFLQYSYLDAGYYTSGNVGANFNPPQSIIVLSKPKVLDCNNQLILGILYRFNA